MRYVLCDIDSDLCGLLALWASVCNVSTPHLFLVVLDRSRCPVEVYQSGVLVARSATYQGV